MNPLARSSAVSGAPHAPVLYVASRFPALSETFVYQEVIALRRLGLDVEVASLRRPGGPRPSDPGLPEAHRVIPVYGSGLPELLATALGEALRHPLRAARTLATAARDALAGRDLSLRGRAALSIQSLAGLALSARARPLGPRHLHAHMANAPTTVAMYAAMQLGVPFSFTGHANDLFVDGSLLREKLARADFVSCISRWHRGFYRRFAYVSDERLPVVRCGVETAEPVQTAQADAPHSAPAELRVLSVGRLVPKKGMDVLVRAIAALGPGSPWQCDIVGDGPLHNQLAELIQELGASDRVRLLGPRPNHEVLAMVQRCDVFVLACQRDPGTGDQDGIPVSLMEAMAAERCVVTSTLEPLGELVEDGVTGLCAPPGDHQALARVLARLAEDAALRATLARQGRRHVVDEFDRRVNALRLLDMFRATPGGPRPESGITQGPGAAPIHAAGHAQGAAR